jgi:hypothetical protein
MPRLSRFFGITVFMNYSDHSPPHFHAEYGGKEAVFLIDTLQLRAGELPRRARSLVVEWAALHRAELMADWDRAREGLPLAQIEPLD